MNSKISENASNISNMKNIVQNYVSNGAYNLQVKVYIETLGCSKNQVDSEMMIGIYHQNSYILTADASEAQVIVVNTCGFIEDAKVESVNAILEMAEYKKYGICKALIVAGCLSQRYAYELSEEIPEVDAYIGTAQFDKIVEITDKLLCIDKKVDLDNELKIDNEANVDNELEFNDLIQIQHFKNQNEKNIDLIKNEPIIKIEDVSRLLPINLPRVRISPSHMAYLKIAEGCDNLCTYCIIPKIRGKYRSRPMQDIINEAKILVAEGVRELVLIAQDTTRYGIDIYNKYSLAELLTELNNIDDLHWIRIQYMYPDVIDSNLIQTIASLDKVVKYVDIPIQHASDKVLKRMNRHTTSEHIRNVVNSFREHMPNITIRTTCIVGFPNESDEDFEILKNFIADMKFDRLGAFIYSPEEDTPAYKMKGHLADDIKKQRYDELMEIQMRISAESLNKKIGTVMEVIIEEMVEETDEGIMYAGRSQMDSPEIDGVVYVSSLKKCKIGEFVNVNIVDALEYDLIGEIV